MTSSLCPLPLSLNASSSHMPSSPSDTNLGMVAVLLSIPNVGIYTYKHVFGVSKRVVVYIEYELMMQRKENKDMADWDKGVIEEFRMNGGKVGGRWESMHLLLLITTGARSGQRRVTPLAYLPDNDCLIVLAAAGGTPTHPGWYHNLVAHPQATVEVGSEIFDVTASIIEAEEREQLYAKMVKRYPQIIGYEEKTSRQFPLIALER